MRLRQRTVVAIATALLLANVAGCDSKAEKAQSFVQEIAANNHPQQQKSFRRKVGDLDITLTYRYKDDVILQQVAEDIAPWRLLPAQNGVEAKAVMNKIAAAYGKLAGVSQKVEYRSNRVHEYLTIDFTQANIQQLCALKDISIGMIITDCTADWLTMSGVERFLREQEFSEVK